MRVTWYTTMSQCKLKYIFTYIINNLYHVGATCCINSWITTNFYPGLQRHVALKLYIVSAGFVLTWVPWQTSNSFYVLHFFNFSTFVELVHVLLRSNFSMMIELWVKYYIPWYLVIGEMQLCQVDQVTDLCWNTLKVIVIHAKKLQGYQPEYSEDYNKTELKPKSEHVK